MKRVVIRAPLLSISGYGEHSRQVYRYLKTKNIQLKTQIVQWGNTPWMINSEGFSGLADDVMNSSTPENTGFDVSFQVQLPDEWTTTLANYNVGITAGVETDICNPSWIESINKMDLVIVPSTHVRDTFARTGIVTTKIVVVGEWHQENLDLAPLEHILNINFDTNFNFLLVSQLTATDDLHDRKNIMNTIKWFCESFKDDKDVGLIIKTNLGRGTQIDRDQVYHVIKNLLGQVRKSQYPRIHVLHGNMSDHEICSLYRHKSIKGFISLTRGEGFGLPILDASVAGLPVITTNWSGHLDFMKLGKFVGVNYELIKIPPNKIDKRIFVENSMWANPSEEDFKKRIKKFRSSFLTPKEWAEELSIKCKDKFSRSAIEKNYDDLLGQILT